MVWEGVKDGQQDQDLQSTSTDETVFNSLVCSFLNRIRISLPFVQF